MSEEVYIIQRDDDLVRRVPKLVGFINENTPTSNAFKTKAGEDGLSVNILALTTIEDSVLDKELFAVAIFKASLPMDENYECIHSPQTENQAHALIMGDTKRIARKLSRSCRLQYID